MSLPQLARARIIFGGGCNAGRALLLWAVSLLLLFAAPLFFTPGASAQSTTKNVLIISGSDPNHPGFSILTQRVRSIVRDGSAERVELLYELQEGLIKPPDSPREDEELVAYLKQKYGGKKIDLIFSGAAPRLKILLKNNPDLFQGVPKVFYDYEEEREATYHDAGPHITGVWARIDLSPTLDLAFALHPEARRVVVVAGNSPQGETLRARARAEFSKYEARAEFVYLTDLTLAELKVRLAALPRDNIVYYLTFYTDRVGNRYPGGEALSVVAPTSGAPIYGTTGSYMGAGIVGGSLIDIEGIGQRVGEMCLRILNGERPEDIPSQTAPNVTTFDWRELKRWGIDEESLPPGSIVKFKEFSFWELYRWYIIATIAACIIEALLIAYLLVVQRRRRLAERERERLVAQVKAEHRRLNETVSNVPGIVWETLFDPKTETMKTVFISAYVEKMLGYTSGAWLSSPPGLGYRLIPKADRERAAHASEEVMKSGKEAVIEHRWRAKDGRMLWVENHLSPMVGETGKVVGLRGVSIDITEKKLAEEARRQSEERNRATLRAIPDLMFLQTRDGVYLDYYARDVKELYVPPEQFIGKNMRDVVPPELAEIFLERFRFVDESGDPQVVEYSLPIEGEERWYESRLVRSGENILSVVRDITERKAAGEALRKSEEKYRTLFESIDEGFCVIELLQDSNGSAVDGVFTVTNPAFERHTGWKDAQGRRIGELVPDREDFWFKRYGRIAATGEPDRFTGHAAAMSKWFDVYAFRVGEEGSRTVAVLFSDVSERIRGEEKIRRSEAVLAQAGRMANLGAWEVDLTRSAEINENPLAWSDQVYRIYGYEPGSVEVTSGLFFHHVHPDDRRRIDEEIRAAVAGRRPYEQEHRIIRPDGAERVVQEHAVVDVDESGRPLRILGAVQDITERKLAEEALRQSEARFRNMADTAPVLIWMAGADNLCIYVNKQWLDFTGRSMDEELSNGWVEGIHPDDYASCIETYTSGFDRREPFTKEYRLRRVDGAYRWVFDTGTPRFSSSGQFLGYIGSCVDIHDRKESEEALQKVMEELNRLKNQLQEENVYLREEIKLEHNFNEFVGRSDAIKYVLHKIEQVAPTDSTVLISGETGTGKELVARAIHGESHRRTRPLVKVNCAALSPSLIESELFGHERGAFTGATGRKMGRFELADGATIFLDEIGELPLELQVKLLRIIQEGEFERLGGNKTIKVDVRIIAATNRNLSKEVQAGTFREDLFYRLNVFPITVPPLRQRAEDIPPLVEHFVGSISRKMGKKITSVTPATLNALCNYAWPGNVRELANVIERAVINNSGPVLQISNLAEALSAETLSASRKTLEEMEREYIVAVLDSTGWQIEGQQGAARILGLHPSTLRTRMAKLKVQRPT